MQIEIDVYLLPNQLFKSDTKSLINIHSDLICPLIQSRTTNTARSLPIGYITVLVFMMSTSFKLLIKLERVARTLNQTT